MAVSFSASSFFSLLLAVDGVAGASFGSWVASLIILSCSDRFRWLMRRTSIFRISSAGEPGWEKHLEVEKDTRYTERGRKGRESGYYRERQKNIA